MPQDGLWVNIDPSRFAAGHLWPSNLSLDHLGRHVSLFGFVSEMQIATLTNSGGTQTTALSIIYPDSWAFAPTFADLSLVLQVVPNILVSGTGNWTMSLVGGSNSIAIGNGEAGPRFLTKHYTSIPTGVVTETLTTTRTSGTGTLTVSRDGTSGVNCGWSLEPV